MLAIINQQLLANETGNTSVLSPYSISHDLPNAEIGRKIIKRTLRDGLKTSAKDISKIASSLKKYCPNIKSMTVTSLKQFIETRDFDDGSQELATYYLITTHADYNDHTYENRSFWIDENYHEVAALKPQ